LRVSSTAADWPEAIAVARNCRPCQSRNPKRADRDTIMLPPESVAQVRRQLAHGGAHGQFPAHAGMRAPGTEDRLTFDGQASSSSETMTRRIIARIAAAPALRGSAAWVRGDTEGRRLVDGSISRTCSDGTRPAPAPLQRHPVPSRAISLHARRMREPLGEKKKKKEMSEKKKKKKAGAITNRVRRSNVFIRRIAVRLHAPRPPKDWPRSHHRLPNAPWIVA